MIKHSIDTGDAMPVCQQPRRMSTKQKQEVGKFVDDMPDDDILVLLAHLSNRGLVQLFWLRKKTAVSVLC